MKIYIDKEEWYPIYTLENESYCNTTLYDFDEKFIEKYKQVLEDFNEIQYKLAEVYNGNKK